MKRSFVLCLGFLTCFAACSGTSGDSVTKAQAAQQAALDGKADHHGKDECAENGWYGDGECDTFCPHHDPDCGAGSGGGDSCGCSGGGGDNPPPACVPTTCAAQGASCGSISDGCGGTLSCGSCSGTDTCGGGGTANVCGSPPSKGPFLDWTCQIDRIRNGQPETIEATLCDFASSVEQTAEYYNGAYLESTGVTPGSVHASNCVSHGCCWNGCDR